MKPPATSPEMRPAATVFFPVVVLCVMIVLVSAYLRRGPNRALPEGR